MKTDNIHIKTFSNKRRVHKTCEDEGRWLFDPSPDGLNGDKTLLTGDQLHHLIEAIELDEAINSPKKKS